MSFLKDIIDKQRLKRCLELLKSHVATSVNGNKPDSNGAVNVDVGVKTIDSITPDEEGNVKIPVATDEEVEAGEVDNKYMTPANTLFAINKRTANFYNSVSDMKSDRKLKAGMTACTLGYYEPNDGGAGTYIIRAKQDGDVDDGGSLHEISSKLVAELVVENGTVYPEQFGAKTTEGYDDSFAIVKALNSKASVLAFNAKTYFVYKTIFLPPYAHLKGCGVYGKGTSIHFMANELEDNFALFTCNKRNIIIEDLILANYTQNYEITEAINSTLFKGGDNHLQTFKNLRIIGFYMGIHLEGSIYWDCLIDKVRLTQCNIGLRIVNCFNVKCYELYTDRCTNIGIDLHGVCTILFQNCNIGVYADKCISVGGSSNENLKTYILNITFDSCNFEYDKKLDSANGGIFFISDYANCNLLFTNNRFTLNGQNENVHSIRMGLHSKATFINNFYYPNSDINYPDSFFNEQGIATLAFGSITFVNGNIDFPRPKTYFIPNIRDFEKDNGMIKWNNINSMNQYYSDKLTDGFIWYNTLTKKLYIYINGEHKEII